MAAVLAGVGSVATNLIVLFVGKPFVGLTTDLAPLSLGPVIGWSVIGVVGATIVFALVRKYSKNPDNTFLTIAGIVLVLSFIPDILIKNVTSGPFAGATWGAIALLMLMHVVAAAFVYFFFLHKVRPTIAKSA